MSPDGGCADLLKGEFAAAETSIHVAVYTFTNADLADHLLLAQQRGVEVQVVTDPWEANWGMFTALEADGIPVRYAPNPNGAIMHHKFAVIDERMVLTGSYNWTDSAENLNDENLVRLNHVQAAMDFEDTFQELWQRGE